MSFTIDLLPPPSINNAFINVPMRGRAKSKEYSKWCVYAKAAIKVGVPEAEAIVGKFIVAINLPRKMRGDIDNRVKGILDALVTSGRIQDDRHMEELHVCRRADREFATIIVRRFQDV